MCKLELPTNEIGENDLNELSQRCARAVTRIKSPDSEVRLPIIIEFAGSPKSGKTTVIEIVAHFLRRMKLDLARPAEGASLRTPDGLRDDWLAFNAWSGCYALQNILIDCHTDPPLDCVILDRGLFDVAGWMEFLLDQGRLSKSDRDAITAFFLLDLWRARENCVFLFTADHQTSLERETYQRLTTQSGAVMNRDVLAQLQRAYDQAATRQGHLFPRLYSVDTSRRGDGAPSFQQIAYAVAKTIVDVLDALGTQSLLVTNPAPFEGFNTERSTLEAMVETILNNNAPRFRAREEVEDDLQVQQVVPYAVLKDSKGRFFWAKRRADARHKELRAKYSLLAGGHAEERDWNREEPQAVFERCLRRELEEELIGIQITRIEALGFINDTRNKMGCHHLAFIHQVEVGGRPLIRRQAIDKEFGRETVSWKTPEEIKAGALELDPWSQLVAERLFGAVVSQSDEDPTLFTGP